MTTITYSTYARQMKRNWSAYGQEMQRRRESMSDAQFIEHLLYENRRLQNEIDTAAEKLAQAGERIEELEDENDAQRGKLLNLQHTTRSRARGKSANLQVNGREVVNQTEAARLLGVEPYQVSRWVSAGHFQTTKHGRRELIFVDSLHKPAPKRKGRKKSQQR